MTPQEKPVEPKEAGELGGETRLGITRWPTDKNCVIVLGHLDEKFQALIREGANYLAGSKFYAEQWEISKNEIKFLEAERERLRGALVEFRRKLKSLGDENDTENQEGLISTRIVEELERAFDSAFPTIAPGDEGADAALADKGGK